MSLDVLTPKPGVERYTTQVERHPHRTYFATVIDLTCDPGADPHNKPDTVRIEVVETILDPAEVQLAAEPYTDTPADRATKLRADQAAHPVPR